MIDGCRDPQCGRDKAGGGGHDFGFVNAESKQRGIDTHIDQLAVGIAARQNQPGVTTGKRHDIVVEVDVGHQVHRVRAGQFPFRGHHFNGCGLETKGGFGGYVGFSVRNHDHVVLVVAVVRFFESDHETVRYEASLAIPHPVHPGPVVHAPRIKRIFRVEGTGTASGGYVKPEA